MSRSTDIDRKTASDLLNVSVRTIDRYVRAGKLSARYTNGRVLLDKKEIIRMRPLLGGSTGPMEITRNETRQEIPVQTPEPISRTPHQDDFYRDLYEESKQALREYQQELQDANFKIGQLESRLNFHTEKITEVSNIAHQPHTPATMPAHNERQETYTLELLRKEIRDREHDLVLLKEHLTKEKNARVIFAILTYLLLILQPVFWYLLK